MDCWARYTATRRRPTRPQPASYLASGHFGAARGALARALDGVGRPELERLSHYADGMHAYLAGRYADAIAQLGQWVDGGPETDEQSYADLAYTALSRVNQLVGADERTVLVAAANALMARPASVFPPGRRRVRHGIQGVRPHHLAYSGESSSTSSRSVRTP